MLAVKMNMYFSRHGVRLGTVYKHKLVTHIQLVIGMCWEGNKYCLLSNLALATGLTSRDETILCMLELRSYHIIGT